MQRYRLSTRDGKVMVALGRITVPLTDSIKRQLHLPQNIAVTDIESLNVGLRGERRQVYMPNLGMGKDKRKENRDRKWRRGGFVKLEITGLNVEMDLREKVKKAIQKLPDAEAVVTEVGKDSVKMRIRLSHSDDDKLEAFLEAVASLQVERKDKDGKDVRVRAIEKKDDYKYTFPD